MEFYLSVFGYKLYKTVLWFLVIFITLAVIRNIYNRRMQVSQKYRELDKKKDPFSVIWCFPMMKNYIAVSLLVLVYWFAISGPLKFHNSSEIESRAEKIIDDIESLRDNVDVKSKEDIIRERALKKAQELKSKTEEYQQKLKQEQQESKEYIENLLKEDGNGKN